MQSNKIGTTVGAAVTAATVVLGMMTAAPAAADTIAGSGTPTLSDRTWAALGDGIGTDGVFDGDVPRRAGVPEGLIDDFATGWSAEGGSVTGAAVDTAVVERARTAQASVRSCVGKNRLDDAGIQINLYLNPCKAASVLGLVTSGAGIAVIAAAVTAATGVGALAAGVIAGVLGVSAGVLTSCTARGRGIAAHNIPPSAVMWCNNQ